MRTYDDTVLAPHLEHRQGFEFIAASAIDDAVQDGVIVLEMSFDVRFALSSIRMGSPNFVHLFKR